MKKILMIIAALAAIMTLSLGAVAFENHVRWNYQLNECVYFFEDDGTSVSQPARVSNPVQLSSRLHYTRFIRSPSPSATP